MSSIKEFVAKTLCPALIEDARRHRIFNETDLQTRAAYHLHRGYIEKYTGTYLLNEPHIPIGKGRGTAKAKPDIMLCEFKDGPLPFAAIELKCYLDNADNKLPAIIRCLGEDIENLGKTSQRYQTLENVFSIALLDMQDKEEFEILNRDFQRKIEDWQKHFLKVHLINMRSVIQRGYDTWAEEWEARRLSSYRIPKITGRVEEKGVMKEIAARFF